MAEVASEPVLSAIAVPPAAGSDMSDSDSIPLIVAEYGSLRAEILQLIGLQSQLIALTVLAFGTVLSVGFQADKAIIILIYPFLSLILGICWLNHAHAIYRCADYIAQRIEVKFGKVMGWENFVRTQHLPKAAIGYWGVRSIFMGSSVLSIVAGSIIPKHGPSAWTFYYLAIGVTILTVLIFLFWRERPPPSDRVPAASSSPVVLRSEQGALPIRHGSVSEQEHPGGPALP